MNYLINGTEYRIDEYEDRFAWVTNDSEAALSFKTPLEALQNAVDYERMISDAKEQGLADALEEEMYGSYEKQINDLYKATRL